MNVAKLHCNPNRLLQVEHCMRPLAGPVKYIADLMYAFRPVPSTVTRIPSLVQSHAAVVSQAGTYLFGRSFLLLFK
jgi:hypothetical protein